MGLVKVPNPHTHKLPKGSFFYLVFMRTQFAPAGANIFISNIRTQFSVRICLYLAFKNFCGVRMHFYCLSIFTLACSSFNVHISVSSCVRTNKIICVYEYRWCRKSLDGRSCVLVFSLGRK
jgi:hypothetical protein